MVTKTESMLGNLQSRKIQCGSITTFFVIILASILVIFGIYRYNNPSLLDAMKNCDRIENSMKMSDPDYEEYNIKCKKINEQYRLERLKERKDSVNGYLDSQK